MLGERGILAKKEAREREEKKIRALREHYPRGGRGGFHKVEKHSLWGH